MEVSKSSTIMYVGIFLALVVALAFQQVLSAQKDDTQQQSLRQALANWIRSQDAFSHWNSSPTNDDITLQMNVVEWVRENGGYWNPKQEFRRLVPGDASTPFGVFARETIKKDELVASVPWKCIMTAGTDTWETYMHCNTTRFIIEEMRKGNDSFYAPYTAYLMSAPPVNIPSMWSQPAKDLLREVIGWKQLPPSRAMLWMTKYWKQECNGSDDPFEIQAAMQLVSRGDDDTLTPVYDMYNHRNGKWLNTRPKMIEEKRHEMYASRDIEAGQEIYLSYNQCEDCFNRHYDFGTPEMLRDYGFVEQFPQRWIFHMYEIALDIDKNEETGQLEVTWLDESVHKKFGKLYEVTEWGIGELRNHLQRLKELYETKLEAVEEGTSDVEIPRHELDSLMSYYHALTKALELAVESSEDYLSSNGADEEQEE